MEKIIPINVIEKRIFFFRKQKVMIDHDLAELYQVSTKSLNQAVKRNLDRFPLGFMFQLSRSEKRNWSQIVTGCLDSNIHLVSHMLLQSKELPCFLAYLKVKGLYRLIC